ncbi:aspartyl protease family protein [Aurantiacibacter gangjinensis]|uniref:Uncharacterized protein n=1 Tax=Aurantiacibacter gangjinensis TaxID=502682 RepID=A0A0G9MMG2_9SPHN|nr:aspartyl protease family protein [Aurantiacibacter gangjinensis]APE27930.1 hypothetical protein BMF35_a1101 [Aurantiacibacter gangjinensis]KLE31880.1 hypothetical protein AAW01_10475 [Aurantiacibacter gangjinensis]
MNWVAIAGAAALLGAGSGIPTDPVMPLPDIESEAETEQVDAAEEPVSETIGMQIERYRRMTVPVTIMGTGPYRFMVDTGSQATVLSTELADELQLLERETANLVGMASTRLVETTFVPDFGIGERTISIRTAPLVERSNIGAADGILGLDSLQDQRVLLDFRAGEMIVSDSYEMGTANGYDITVRARERLGQLIIHRAVLDGVRVRVIVDTGATGSVGNPALQERLRRRRDLADATITDVNGIAIASETSLARNLELGGATVQNIVISFADSPAFHHLGLDDRPALILGMAELRLFDRVAIDFRSRKVLFDIPGGVPTDQAWRFNQPATRLRD